ncbi:MAG: dihydropteroate synthase [Deltaproteobacteria bacterium]|nr:dihydropteroate synthase [Deltaproteobacteria bacterium]
MIFDPKGRVLLMGILNLTPDSFSDGGLYLDPSKGLDRALQMIEEGADIIDLGGESTRPGSSPVSLEEERRRVLPVLKKIRARTTVPISIDTQKAALAEEALQEGANIINDVSAATFDPEMAAVIVKHRSPLILMHKQGSPETMQKSPTYKDVVGEVFQYLQERIKTLVAQSIPRELLWVDPGIGFGKTFLHNKELLQNLPKLKPLECPIVVGVSRKSFLGQISGRPVEDRLIESLAASFYTVLQGANVLRVHDVLETKRVLKVLEALS